MAYGIFKIPCNDKFNCFEVILTKYKTAFNPFKLSGTSNTLSIFLNVNFECIINNNLVNKNINLYQVNK